MKDDTEEADGDQTADGTECHAKEFDLCHGSAQKP